MTTSICNIATTIAAKCHVLSLPLCIYSEDNSNMTTTYYSLMLQDSKQKCIQRVDLNVSESQQHKCFTFKWLNDYHMSAERQLTIDADCTSKELSALLHTIEDDFC